MLRLVTYTGLNFPGPYYIFPEKFADGANINNI